MKPHDFYFSSPMFAGNNGWGVLVNLPEPYPKDAWSQEIKVDKIYIGLPANTRFHPGGFFHSSVSPSYPPKEVFEGSMSDRLKALKEWSEPDYEFVVDMLNKKYKFFYLNNNQQKEIIKFLENYICLDVDDVCNCPMLGATYACGANDDSDDPRWNELVKKIYNEQRQAKKEEEIKNVIPKNEYFLECYYARYQPRHNPYEKEGIIYKTVFGWVRGDAANEFIKAHVHNQKIREKQKEKYARMLEKKKKILNKEMPIASYTTENGVVDVYLENGTIKVPKNYMGHAIGRGGAKINDMKRIFGYIKIIPTEEVPVTRKYTHFDYHIDYVHPESAGLEMIYEWWSEFDVIEFIEKIY